MQVRLLGQIEAAHAADQAPIALGGPTQRRVLGALALRRNEVVSVQHLVDVVWHGDDVPARADHNVRTYVHRLRSALGEQVDRLETVGAGYRLRLEDDDLDVARFEHLAGAATRLAGTGDAVAAVDAIVEAERLWRGAPLEEFAHEDWALPDVARLEELHATLRTRHAEALLDAGRAAEAVVVLDRLVADEPLRERPRASLVRALYESGRQAEALRAFQEFRRMLLDEIGVEPSSDLVELDRAIATGALAASTPIRRIGNYELHERTGEGAFAVVHRATQTSLGREVAVKIVRAELANRPEFIRRFEAEAQMVAAIEHPHVVPLYDYWREPDRALLVMRWMTGGSLENRLDDGRWTVVDAAELVDQIAAALDAAHRHGVVHRDVKPGNILFDGAGRAYLGDFGIALDADERSSPEAALSEGSPVFAAPEQLRRQPVGPEADVHALGIVAYTLLAGRIPFADAPDEPTRLQRHLHDPVPSLCDQRPELPSSVDEVLAVATAKDPTDRYPTASGFAAAFRSACTGGVATTDHPAAMRPRVNPYKGLRAFDETDAADFHGRERLIDELVDQLRRPDSRILAVVGPSGSGKSSVVRAGAIPALRDGRVPGSAAWFITTMIPGAHPFEALETALLRVAVNPPAALLDQLRDGDRGVLRALKRIVPTDDGVVTIVVDQFEELFTGSVADDERDQFLCALAVAATEPTSPARVILTLRADFYDRPLRHPALAPLLKVHTVVVTPLAPDELEHAITAPAAAVGVGFEPGLVAEIVADVNHEPGALPLLQYALTQAFDTTDSDTITIDAYRSIGGLTGALGRRADELHCSLDTDEQQTARRLFGRLVALGEGTEDTRRRVRLAELRPTSSTEAVLDRFGSARLLTFDRDPATREPTVEIAHEALIRQWPRLRGWLDDDRDGLRIHRHLTDTAAAWIASRRDDGELYRGARLDTAGAWAVDHRPDLNPDEGDFLDASVAAHDAEVATERARFDEQVRANRRLRNLVVLAAAIALIAVGIGVFALQQRSRADEQADEATAQAAAAERARVDAEAARADADENAAAAVDAAVDAAAERVRANDSAFAARQQADAARAAEQQADLERIRAVALATAGQDPSTAALLAVEAYRLDPSIESLDVLHRVLSEIPGYHGSIAAGPYLDAIALDDTTLVAASETAVDVWDLPTRALTRSIPHDGPGGLAIMARLVGDVVAVVDRGRTSTTLLDVATGAAVGTITHTGVVADVAATRDGTRIAAGLAGGRVEIWTPNADRPDVVVDTGDDDVSFVRWHPDGRRLAAVLGNGLVELWEPGASGPIWTSTWVEARIVNRVTPFAAAFDPSGERFALVAGSLGPSVQVLDVATGTIAQPEIPFATPNFVIDDLGWRDQDVLVVPSRGNVVSFDLDSGDVGVEVEQYILSGRSAFFSETLGQYVVAGSSGLEFWSTEPSGPLERIIPLTQEQAAVYAVGGGPILSALASDGSRLMVSVFTLTPPAPPMTVVDLSTDPTTFTIADEQAVVIGHGDITLIARTDFTIQLLDREQQAMGPPIPLPLDYTEHGISDDGRFLAYGRLGGLVDVHRIADGDLIGTVELGDATEFAGAQVGPWFTRDGEFMAVTTTDGRSGIWRTEPLERLDVPDAMAGGPILALGDWFFVQRGTVVQRWDPRTLRPVGVPIPLAGFGGLNYPEIDHANLRLASGGTEVAKVFDLETGRQLGRDMPFAGAANRLQYTADGSVLGIPTDEGVGLWNFDTDTWQGIACRFAGRNLTRDEWDQVGPRSVDHRPTCPDYPID